MDALSADGPALAMLTLRDAPSGLRALDALAKEAPVRVVAAGTVQCGYYLILITGEVEPVARAHGEGCRVSSAQVLDQVLLAHCDERIVPAVMGGLVRWPVPGDTLGVLQTTAAPTMVRGVDAALKGALVELVEFRVAEGLGGKALALLWGESHDVEAALGLAQNAMAMGLAEGSSASIVRNADPVVGRAVGAGSRFFKELRG